MKAKIAHNFEDGIFVKYFYLILILIYANMCLLSIFLNFEQWQAD